MELPVGTSAPRFGGAKERDDGFVQRRRHMHGAGIVGHHQLTQPNPLHHFRQRSFSGQIKATCCISATDDFGERPILRRAENREPKLGSCNCQTSDKFSEAFSRPPLVRPACAGLKDDPARICHRPFLTDCLRGGRTFRQPSEALLQEERRVPTLRVDGETVPQRWRRALWTR